jgi:hypothetical protein
MPWLLPEQSGAMTIAAPWFSRAQAAVNFFQDHGTAEVQSREPQVSVTSALVWCTVSKFPLGSSALCMV